jgi:hypothetical protein
LVQFSLTAVALWAGGCSRPSAAPDGELGESIALLMPKQIDIMPFTRIESFDADRRPDGIALLLRPVNSLGAPVNIVGDLRAELYEFRPASGEPQGARLAHWDMSLRTDVDQARHWNATTQMYEFRLESDPDRLPRHRKYVLEVTYSTPLGSYLRDSYILEAPMERKPFGGGQTQTPRQG